MKFELKFKYFSSCYMLIVSYLWPIAYYTENDWTHLPEDFVFINVYYLIHRTWYLELLFAMLHAVVYIAIALWLTWDGPWLCISCFAAVKFFTANAFSNIVSNGQWHPVIWHAERVDGQYKARLCHMWRSCLGQALWRLQVHTRPVRLLCVSLVTVLSRCDCCNLRLCLMIGMKL